MMFGLEQVTTLDTMAAVQVVMLGFIGGVLSGFIGSGGAFFMAPGMMNLGVPGAIAVGTNIAHKFGKSIVGSSRHSRMGHVDKKLGFFMLITAVIGIRLAVWINERLFKIGSAQSQSSAAGDLYISGVFVVILLVVSIFILRDALRHPEKDTGPSTRLAETVSRIHIPPVISFRVTDVRLSFWVIAVVGLATGYLAGTIGVGGFIGVPAMIYLFGVPTAVAAGTEMFLAIFMGLWGSINYAWGGMVDLRLVFLLYAGSLAGVHIGAYGTKVVKERVIRLVTGIIILLCVLSRAISIPVYLDELGWINLTEGAEVWINGASKYVLYASGIAGVLVILGAVARSHRRRRQAQKVLENIRAEA